MAETIDSLLVSLGLETDAKSFQKATSVISGVKNSIIQLGAAAGTGLGGHAVTYGVSQRIQEIERLGKITNFTTRQIEGLRFSLRSIGVSDGNAAANIVQKIPALQQAAREGQLNTQAYWSGSFNPTQFSTMSGLDALMYLAESYSGMNNDQRRTLRGGIGIGENDSLTRLLETGSDGISQQLRRFDRLYQETDPQLLLNAEMLNDATARLSVNFENLANAMGSDLTGPLSAVLNILSQFIESHPVLAKWTGYAAGVGGAAATAKIAGSLFGKKIAVPGSGVLMNPFVAGPVAAFTPGNAFVSTEDARAMSNPEAHARRNWEINNPGVPYQVPAWRRGNPSGILSENERSYLDIIAKSEGTSHYANDGYQTLFGGGQFTDLSDHPRQYFDHKGTRTSAAGRYQITAQSWDDAKRALGLTDFSPASQDQAAVWLAERAGQGENIRNGHFNAATQNLLNVWTGLRSRQGQDVLADYNYRRNQRPVDASGGAGGAVTVTQTNYNTIQANGADAGEVERRLSEKTTSDLAEALALNKTDKF